MMTSDPENVNIEVGLQNVFLSTLPPNTTTPGGNVANRITRATFLAIFLVAGFVGNSVLIATIAQSTRLKTLPLNIFIISIAVANIVDCAGNMPLVLGATITEKWDYGDLVCRLNAFALQAISIVVILSLCMVTIERALSLLSLRNPQRCLSHRQTTILVVYCWVYSLAFSWPLLIQNILTVQPSANRHLCTISRNSPVIYLALMSILCYLLPCLLIIGFLIYIIRQGVIEKMNDRQNAAQNSYAAESGGLPERQVWSELYAAKYVGVLFLFWVLLQAPYLVLSSIDWYKQSNELSDIEAISEIELNNPWQVQLAFTWIKFSFPMVMPLLTFFWRKETWQRFKNWILCRKSNFVVDASPKTSPQHKVAGVKNGATTTTSVPVLFATENGLHVQTYSPAGNNNDDHCDNVSENPDTLNASNTQALMTQKCDVMGSQDFLQIDEDTSDYDSSGETEAVSSKPPPVVTRQRSRQQSQSSQKSEKRSSQKSSDLSIDGSSSMSHEHDDTSDHSGHMKLSSEATHMANVYIVSEREPGRKRKKRSSESLSDHSSPRSPTDGSVPFEVTPVCGIVNQAFLSDPAADHMNHQDTGDLEQNQDSGMGSLEDRKKRLKTPKVEREATPAPEMDSIQGSVTIVADENDEENDDSKKAPARRRRKKRESGGTESVVESGSLPPLNSRPRPVPLPRSISSNPGQNKPIPASRVKSATAVNQILSRPLSDPGVGKPDPDTSGGSSAPVAANRNIKPLNKATRAQQNIHVRRLESKEAETMETPFDSGSKPSRDNTLVVPAPVVTPGGNIEKHTNSAHPVRNGSSNQRPVITVGTTDPVTLATKSKKQKRRKADVPHSGLDHNIDDVQALW